MADPNPPQGAQGLVIPEETQKAFGPLLELIKGSESMNNEERQYWINILPIMTPEQIKNLEEILTSEKQQLAAIDAKYAASASTNSPQDLEQKIIRKKAEREQKEKEAATMEEGKEADIMAAIQSL